MPESSAILLIGIPSSDLTALAASLKNAGFSCSHTANLAGLRRQLKVKKWALALLHLDSDRLDGMEALRTIRLAAPGLPVICLAASPDENRMHAAIHSGAADLLRAADVDAITHAVTRELLRISSQAQAAPRARTGFEWSVINDKAPHGVCLTDEEGRLILWNDEMASLSGVKASDVIQRYAWDVPYITHSIGGKQTPASVFREQAQRLLKTGEASWVDLPNEFELRHPDGSRVFIQQVYFPVKTAKGYRLASIAFNITGQKAAQNELLQSQGSMSALLESAEDLVWSLNANMSLLSYNPAMEKFFEGYFGLPLQRTIMVEDIIAPAHASLWAEVNNRVLQGEKIRQEFELKDGKYLDISFTPIRAAGVVTGISGFAKDITERRKTEKALRESEALYHTLVNTSPDAILTIDLDRIVTFASPTAVTLLNGSSARPILGCDVLQWIHPEDRDMILQDIDTELRGEAVGKSVYRMIRSDGVHLIADVNANQLTDADGQPTGIVAVLRDVTGQVQAENTLQAVLRGTTMVGEEFFRSLVRELSSVLQMHYAFVAEIASPDLLRMVAFCMDGQIRNNFEFNIAGTPAGTIVGQTLRCYPDHVQQLFPGDLDIINGKVESYMGIPLFSSSGSPLGILSIMNIAPMQRTGYIEDLLTIFGARAAAELERLHAEQRLRESEARLYTAVESLPFDLWVVDSNKRYAILNRLSLEHWGDLSGKIQGDVEAPDDTRARWERNDQLAWSGIITEDDLVYNFNGENRIYHEIVAPIRQEGEIRGILGVGVDVTERVRNEEKVQQQNVRLKAMNTVSEMLASAGEDIPHLLEAVTECVSDRLGDLCAIQLLSDDQRQIQLTSMHYHDLNAIAAVNLLGTAVLGKGELGKKINAGQSVLFSGAELEQMKKQTNRQTGMVIDRLNAQSLCFLPLRWQGRVAGLLTMIRRGVMPSFTSEDQAFYQELADRIAQAVGAKRLYAENLRHLEQLEALRAVDVAITSSFDLNMTLSVVIDQVLSHLKLDAADIFLLNPLMHTLIFSTGRGFHGSQIQKLRLRLDECFSGKPALNRQMIYISNLEKEISPDQYPKAFRDEGFVSYVGIPLLAKGQVKGVLDIYHRAAFPPNDEWFSFLETLSSQVAIAVDNTALFRDLQRTNFELNLAYDATINGWSQAMDLRDRETEGHTLRVTEMTEHLARQLGIRDNEIMHLRRGALLHDIGKMGVPDSILLKPGRLTDDEWQVMHRHPQYAYDLLSSISYLRPAIDIPYCHHERWDGKGYPRGLTGEQIPLSARIFSVVDVWDALQSDRPYRNGWERDRVRQHIAANSGSMFDPHVVEAFIEHEDTIVPL